MSKEKIGEKSPIYSFIRPQPSSYLSGTSTAADGADGLMELQSERGRITFWFDLRYLQDSGAFLLNLVQTGQKISRK